VVKSGIQAPQNIGGIGARSPPPKPPSSSTNATSSAGDKK